MNQDLSITLGHWLVALNSRGNLADLQLAVSPAIAVERLGFHYERGQVVERLHGLPAVQEWLARTAAVVRFELAADLPLQLGDGRWQVRYVVTAPDDFVGGGTWLLRLDDAGRILALQHQPDDLGREHWGPEPELAHDHDHDQHHDQHHEQLRH